MSPGDLVVPMMVPWLMCTSWPNDGGRVRWEAGDPGLIVWIAHSFGLYTTSAPVLVLLGDGRVWHTWADSTVVRVVWSMDRRA